MRKEESNWSVGKRWTRNMVTHLQLISSLSPVPKADSTYQGLIEWLLYCHIRLASAPVTHQSTLTVGRKDLAAIHWYIKHKTLPV